MPKLYNVSTKKVEELDGQDLQTALATGTHSYPAGTTVDVFTPEGEKANLPSENVKAALAQGFKVAGPTDKAVAQYVEENKGLKGALKVGLGQFADEALFGLPEMIMNKTADPFEVAKKEALKQEHEYANTLGGIGGFGASLFTGAPLFKLGTKASEKAAGLIAGKIVAQSAGEVSKRTATAAARELLAKTVGAGVEGAVLASPHAITEAALGDYEAAGESLLMGVGIGSLFGAGTVGAKELFKLGEKGARAALLSGQEAAAAASDTSRLAARKLAKVITGVDEDQILRYANNHERINKVGTDYTIEGVKDEVDNALLGLRDKIQVAKEGEQRLKLELDQAYGLEKQRLSQSRAPQSLAPEVMGELEAMKGKLGEKSDELFDVLAGSDTTVSRDALISHLKEQQGSLRPAGEKSAVIGDAAKAEFKRLENMISDLKTFPEQLDLQTTKKVIKQIDPDINFNYASGEFNAISDRNLKSFRKFMNSELRKTPEAASILDEMSRMSDVLGRASKKFGTLEKATSSLNNIFGPKGELNKGLLQELSAVTGKDFVGQLDEFQRAKALVDKAKVEDIRKEILPELTAKYEAAAKELEDLKMWDEPIKRLTTNRTQSIIRNQGFKNASIEDRRALEFLGEITGKNYVELIDDLNTFNAFKSSPNGSRRTLLFGSIGAALGGAPGGAVGGAFGATMDYYGGQVLKKIIDGTPNVSGLLFAEKQLKQVSEKLDEIPKILSSLSDKVPVKAKSGSLEALLRLTQDDHGSKSRTESVEERTKRLREFTDKAAVWAANPNAATQNMQRLIGPLAEGGAPNIAGAFGSKYNEAVQYVFSQAPKPPRPRSPFAPHVEWKPSDQELSAFEQKVQTVVDPFSVLTELQNGTLTKNHIDALKAVYPKIFFKMQEKIQNEMVKGVKPVPYNQRLKLSLLMDAPMDTSMTPQSILNYQKSFVRPQAQIDPSNVKEMKVAEEMASDVQKLMG